MTALPRLTRARATRLAAMGLLGVLLSPLPAALAGAETPVPAETPTANPTATVDRAVAAGSLDRSVAAKVRRGETMRVLVEVSPKLTAGRPDVAAARSRSAVDRAHGKAKVVREFDNVPTKVVEVSTPEALADMLAADGGVTIHEDTAVQLSAQTDAQSLPLIRQPQAAAAGFTGAGTYVAVLDTGVDWAQPVFGTCAAPGSAGCKVALATDVAADDGVRDDIGHGTNVSGIVSMVAPGSRILSYDVFSGASSYYSDQIKALDDVIAKKRAGVNIKAVNMSLGAAGTYYTATCSSALTTSFATLRSLGVQPVVAAGNDAYGKGPYTNGVSAPACTEGALVVGATYDATYTGTAAFKSCSQVNPQVDQMACFSQGGPLVGLVAPGTYIDAAGKDGYSGTSMAAPHVAGAFAVVGGASPTTSPDGIRAALQSTGKAVTDGRTGLVHRRIDVAAAAAKVQPGRTSARHDLTGDGINDIAAVRGADGILFIYPGNGSGGFKAPIQLGGGWNAFDLVMQAGDFDGNAKADLLARKPDGTLWLYSGNGAGGFAVGRQVGTSWQTMTAIVAPGDFDGDGRADVLARKADGTLWLYSGNGAGGWLGWRQVGNGWQGMTAIVAPGDFDGDGRADVLGRRADGSFLLYQGNGSGGWLSTRQVGSGWGGMTQIA